MHILIIQRDADVARELGLTLRERGHTFYVAHSEEEILERVKQAAPDVILFYSDTPSSMGILIHLRETGIETPLMVLSTENDPMRKVSFLDLGADDYLVVPFHLEELLVRIRALARRSRKILFPCIKLGSISLNIREKRVSVEGHHVHLTSYEYKLLEYFARRPDVVINRTTLHEALAPEETALENINVIVHRINKKFEAIHADPYLIEVMRGLGFVLRQPLDP